MKKVLFLMFFIESHIFVCDKEERDMFFEKNQHIIMPLCMIKDSMPHKVHCPQSSQISQVLSSLSRISSTDEFFVEMSSMDFKPLEPCLEVSMKLLQDQEVEWRSCLEFDEFCENRHLCALYTLSNFIQRYKFTCTVMHVRCGAVKNVYTSLSPSVRQSCIHYLRQCGACAETIWESCCFLHNMNTDTYKTVAAGLLRK